MRGVDEVCEVRVRFGFCCFVPLLFSFLGAMAMYECVLSESAGRVKVEGGMK